MHECLRALDNAMEMEQEPRTTPRAAMLSNNEPYTPNTKQEQAELLEETEGLQLRGASAAAHADAQASAEHDFRRPDNTPVEQPDATQALDFNDHESSVGVEEQVREALLVLPNRATVEQMLGVINLQSDFASAFKAAFWYCLETKKHQRTRSSLLQKVLTRYVRLGPGSGLEVKVSALDGSKGFNLCQIRLRNEAHLFFCFDTENDEMYAFFLWSDEIREMLISCSTYHHSPALVGQPVLEIREDVEYEIKPNPRASARTKASYAWNYLVEHHRVPLVGLPQLLIANGIGTALPPVGDSQDEEDTA